MAYYQLYYHIVTATKNREPILVPEVEQLLYSYIEAKVFDLKGTLFAVNGTADHIHIVASIPPAIAVAAFVGQVKGYSSALFNKDHKHRHIAWQEEYGVFSFDRKCLDACVAYVENQKIHHSSNSLIPVLERWEESLKSIGEEPAGYITGIDW